MNELSTKELTKLLAPFLAMTGILTAIAVLVLVKVLAGGSNSTIGTHVVTFDVVKYTNAQRAVASAFLSKGNDLGSTNELLLNLPERTRKTIADVAGEGTLVLLKQSVVQGQPDDITDAVLAKLGLPAAVPTADVPSFVLDTAPTTFMGADLGQSKPARPDFSKQVLP